MPSIPLYPPSSSRGFRNDAPNPLPQLLQTPSGLAIVEIQGTINMPTPDTSEDTDPTHTTSTDQQIGRLAFPLYNPPPPSMSTSTTTTHNPATEDKAWMHRVYLYIGKHQRLTGEVKELRNPIAVVRRRERGDAGNQKGENVTSGTGEQGEDGEANEDEALEIAEIVRYKILFASRPEPVGTEEMVDG